MEQEPSTSSAAKRPRIEEAEMERNGNCVCNYTNCSVEQLIVDIVSYFSDENNWNVEIIERSLIPRILSYSDTFKGGRVADFSKIRNISINQAKVLLRIFRYSSELLIDHMIEPRLQLYYISNFRFLQKLTIKIEDADNFDRTNELLTITSLKIIGENNSFEYDPIAQLINISPQLQKISLQGGQITMFTMTLLKKLNITNIKLKNSKFNSVSKRAMLAYLNSNSNLNSLKLILTQSYFKNEALYELSYKFLKLFSTQYYSLQRLTFTLCQYSDQNLPNLLNFPNLKSLKIYYSAQFNTRNFNNLINIIIQLKNDIEITLIEYYTPPHDKIKHPQSYLNGLAFQSARIKTTLKDSIIGNRIKIITCKDYE